MIRLANSLCWVRSVFRSSLECSKVFQFLRGFPVSTHSVDQSVTQETVPALAVRAAAPVQQHAPKHVLSLQTFAVQALNGLGPARQPPPLSLLQSVHFVRCEATLTARD